MILYAVSRQTLVPEQTSNSSNVKNCLPLMGIIVAVIACECLLALFFYFLNKYNILLNESKFAEPTKFVVLCLLEILFTFLIFKNIPIVQLSFGFSWVLFACAICMICLHGFSLFIIKNLACLPSSLFDLLRSFTYTQYTMAFVVIFYKNYRNYNTYTRYEVESQDYQQNMAKNINILSVQTSSAQEKNKENEITLKKQMNNFIYNLNNLNFYTENLSSSISSQQSQMNNILETAESLLSNLQNQNSQLTNPFISSDKLSFYDSNALFYNDYLNYINGSAQGNALNQINYFQATFSPSEIVALSNLQSTQMASLLNEFLQVQNLMNSVSSYSPQTNSTALSNYLKSRHSISYTNKLSTSIDCNMDFSVSNYSTENVVSIRNTLIDFLTCNSLGISNQNGFDYIMQSNNSCGIGFKVNNLYFLCMQINGSNYCILFNTSNCLVLSQLGWALSSSATPNYFQLLDVMQSNISTASPIILSDNNAYYALKEDYSFSQGMQVTTNPVSSFSTFNSSIDNVNWSLNSSILNFMLNNSGITVAFDARSITIKNSNVTAIFSGGNFSLNNNGVSFSGTYFPLTF